MLSVFWLIIAVNWLGNIPLLHSLSIMLKMTTFHQTKEVYHLLYLVFIVINYSVPIKTGPQYKLL